MRIEIVSIFITFCNIFSRLGEIDKFYTHTVDYQPLSKWANDTRNITDDTDYGVNQTTIETYNNISYMYLAEDNAEARDEGSWTYSELLAKAEYYTSEDFKDYYESSFLNVKEDQPLLIKLRTNDRDCS